jgi:NADH-quinone oxidoreductase subunit E
LRRAGPFAYNPAVRPSPRDLEALTARSAGRPRALIQVLQDVQDRYHWLPPEALEHVSRALGVPLVQVYGVATFYRSFSLSPRGRHVCTVCLGTACHVRGGAAVLEQFERRLGVAAGRTTPDGRVTLERVNCLGACALAPLAVVDGRYYGRMTEAKAEAVLADIDKDDAS